jgi:DHA1 family multidrug resistance protein-like MFS transporter
MTFVSSSAPSSKQGKALGFLSVAVYSGSMVGPILGGFLAEIIGYRNSFIASGFLLMLAALLILIPVQENFVRPIAARKMKAGEKSKWLEALGPGLPILFLMLFLAAAQIFDAPIWPLYVQKIHGRLEGAARWTGILNGVAAIGSISAGYWFGRLADRLSPQKLGKKLVFFAGIFMAMIGFFPTFVIIFPARFLLAFCSAGLDPILQMWISHVTPEAKKGTIFGWAVTAKSIGWFISPLISGGIAVGFGIPVMYLFGLLQFWILIPIIKIVSNRVLLLQEENNGRVVTI